MVAGATSFLDFNVFSSQDHQLLTDSFLQIVNGSGYRIFIKSVRGV
jgi:hypothetical protein